MFVHISITKYALQITVRKVHICILTQYIKAVRLKTTFALRLGSRVLMCSGERDKKISILFFCSTVSEYMSIQVYFLCTTVEKERMCFWGELSDVKNGINDQKWSLFLHIARHPRGRGLQRLINIVTQICSAVLRCTRLVATRWLLRLQASHPHISVTKFCNIFFEERKTFLRIPGRLHLSLTSLLGSQFLYLM